MDENETMKPRSINELIDLPYSEMSEEEIEITIQWKAANLARDEQHVQRMKAMHEYFDEQIAIQKSIADSSTKLLEDLTAHAIKRYEEVSANEQEEQMS